MQKKNQIYGKTGLNRKSISCSTITELFCARAANKCKTDEFVKILMGTAVDIQRLNKSLPRIYTYHLKISPLINGNKYM
jgi:hypothetical protein